MPQRYWLEITDRHDLGADLRAPQKNEAGEESYWGYSLIRDIRPGDIILHYDKRRKSVVAFSRAVSIARSKQIKWAAHGMSARNARIRPYRRPGWSLAIDNFTILHSPLFLREIRRRKVDVRRIQNSWANASHDSRYLPFIFRRDGMRPQQAYLTRFPPALVRLFPTLHQVSARVASPTGPSSIGSHVSPSRAKTFGKPYRRDKERRSTSKRQPFDVDPDKIDRGVHAHRMTQDMLADYVKGMGCRPRLARREEPQYDVGWKREGTLYVAEVKSLTKSNEVKQLRLGLGQVLDYWRQLAQSGKRARAVLAVEREPTDRALVDFCRDIGVAVVWPGHFEALEEWPARDMVLSSNWRSTWATASPPTQRLPVRSVHTRSRKSHAPRPALVERRRGRAHTSRPASNLV
ncbi:MAG TPA: hypothetical protein VNZ26_01545 [Vicinamibacterales bacterium]|jgi:hypothetical protein|nr:hypothetical protein [Vicinamibacterales bacterium]